MFRSPHSRLEKSAFTLIELMVVIGIMGVLLGLGINGYHRSSIRNDMRQETERFVGALKELPAMAQSCGALLKSDGTALTRDSKQLNNSTSANTTLAGTQNDSFVWCLYKNDPNHPVKHGLFSSRNAVTLKYSSIFATNTTVAQNLRTGAWLSVYKVSRASESRATGLGKPLFSVIYRENGTPFADGKIEVHLREGNKEFSNISIQIEKMGGIVAR